MALIHGVKLKYTVEPQPMGTAGRLQVCRDLFANRLSVFNGDILTDSILKAVIREHNDASDGDDRLTPVENPQSYGLVETES
jgi:NDP-sugar pyrophosphorylase family protein